ncbi:MAG: right-handed parallel beta-helix repeat-containing protein [Anaerolineales bacterium]|nr:right-handed parallel beta-helix repeat-containing protein [Anaerolineales bacterium]
MNESKFFWQACRLLWMSGILLVLISWGSDVPVSTAVSNISYATTITVDSSRDVSTSLSERCDTHTPCTLRRAIVQARLLAPAARPVLIQFDIPTSDVGYDASQELWELEVKSTTDPAVFRTVEGGQVTIDGTTQPHGRVDGPKIILVGPATGNKNGLIIGVNASGSHDNNIVRGLGFQNFKDHLTINSSHNTIEDNWFGLTSEGQQPYLRNDNPQDGSGSAGVVLISGAEQNLVQQNTFLAFDGVAIALRGNDNTVRHNQIGTNALGLLTLKQTSPSLLCTPEDWLGGGGISADGTGHLIEENIIAGLRQQIFAISTQPDAIWVQSTCTSCTIQNNQVGVDAEGHEVGVCGRGFYLTNTKQVQVIDNVLAETYHSALFLNGALYDANTLRGNIIRKSTPWLIPDDSPKGDDAILRFTGLPDPLEFFNPAKITHIEGTTVSGTAGDGSPCPNCVIELFLDDNDNINEALESVAVVTAKADGTWSATLPTPLADGFGLRTSSTTAQFNTIANISAGTTVGLSELYMPGYVGYLPLITR